MARRKADISLTAITHDTMHERIYQELRKALMSGVMAPGQLLSYRGLAEALGTSPMPVRDAVRRLITERALEGLPNRTIIVPRLTPARLNEIYKIRVSLEGLAAAEAVTHLTDADIETLRDLEGRMESAQTAGDIRGYVDLNWQFHFTIYRLSGMPQLVELIEALWLQIGPMINRKLAAFDHHQSAIDALARRDATAARNAIAEDLIESRDALLARLEEEAKEAPPKKRARAG